MSPTQKVTWFIISIILLIFLAMLIIAPPHRIGELYQAHFHTPHRERLFLSSLGFFVTFAIVRLITHAIRAGIGSLHNISAGNLHIHHLVWGILLLLLVGYLWLVQVGTGMESASRWMSRITSLLYGVGAALTLDEFALWLNLKDVYWTAEGRESIDAVVLFGALLSIAFWGAPFFHGLIRVAAHVLLY
ncbi:MAG TPA: hypothetical protein VLB01_06015 [Thermodesulfobacteriota bacterium]|nr:hypothetical protein [Thermodesulfobacteriota bacterium]